MAGDRKENEEKGKETEEKNQKEEEIQKILKFVAGDGADFKQASAQGGEDEERWRTEFFVVMVLSAHRADHGHGMAVEDYGKKEVNPACSPRRNRVTKQKEKEEREMEVRRRGARNYEARSPPRPSSQATGSAHQTPESRTSSLADEFVDQVRRSMIGTPRSGPGQEPGTFREDFMSGRGGVRRAIPIRRLGTLRWMEKSTQERENRRRGSLRRKERKEERKEKGRRKEKPEPEKKEHEVQERTPCHAQISRSRRSRTLEEEMRESHLQEEIKEAEEQKEEESRPR